MDFTCKAIVHNRLFFMDLALAITRFHNRSVNDRSSLYGLLFFILIQYFLNLLLCSRTVLLYLLFIGLVSNFFRNRCIFVSNLILYNIFIYWLLFFFIFLFVFYSSCVYWSLNSFLSVFVIVQFRHITFCFLDLL